MAKHPFTAGPSAPRPSEPFGFPDEAPDELGFAVGGTYTIDCATCVMQDTTACADCVVTFLCEREPDEAVLLDLGELQALRRLARAGLAPGLRHTAR